MSVLLFPQVTYITVFLPEKPTPNVTYVDVSENLKYFDPGMNKHDLCEQTAQLLFYFYSIFVDSHTLVYIMTFSRIDIVNY